MKILSVAIIVALAGSGPAMAADRAPTSSERAAITKKLQSLGYMSWDDIKLDDDGPREQPKWEVDDARKKDGTRFDVDLEPSSLRVIKEGADD